MFDFRFIFAVLAILVGFLTWQGVDLFGGGVKEATEKPADAVMIPPWRWGEYDYVVLGAEGQP